MKKTESEKRIMQTYISECIFLTIFVSFQYSEETFWLKFTVIRFSTFYFLSLVNRMLTDISCKLFRVNGHVYILIVK